jgi:hypothetical protein
MPAEMPGTNRTRRLLRALPHAHAAAVDEEIEQKICGFCMGLKRGKKYEV